MQGEQAGKKKVIENGDNATKILESAMTPFHAVSPPKRDQNTLFLPSAPRKKNYHFNDKAGTKRQPVP